MLREPEGVTDRGKISRAAALRTNTVARATDVASLRAPITGAAAAIALPPQMAVPTAMSVAVSSATRIWRPSQRPSASAPAMPTIV